MVRLSGTNKEKYPERRSYAHPSLRDKLIGEGHGAYEAFKRNCRNKELQFEGRYHTLLAQAFSWTRSDEGYSYWYGVAQRMGQI